MKTMIFCTTAINNKYDWLLKCKLWKTIIDTICPANMDDCGIDLFMMNDGNLSDEVKALIWTEGDARIHSVGWESQGIGKSNIVCFPDRLGKLHYRGWCRSFFGALDVAKRFGYEKIIHIESDAFVLSDRLWQHLLYEVDKGWEVLWCPRYAFPENAIQVICKDSYEEFSKQAERFKEGIREGIIENLLPYKTINKNFVGDRYGEIGLPLNDKMDYYCQYGDYLKERG